MTLSQEHLQAPAEVLEESPPRAMAESVIEPVTGFSLPPPSIFSSNADLIYFLARRDVVARYKQTKFGLLWVVIQPALMAVVFSIFLGGIARVPTGDDVPYPVFAITGLTLWIAFTMVLTRSSTSVVDGIALVSKVFFPRILIPIASSLAPVVDFVLAFAVAVISMLIFGVIPSPRIILTPIPVGLTVLLAVGMGLWFSALNVRYRDVGTGVQVIVQLGLFVTPIIYPASLVPERLHYLYALNPLVGIFELYRWAVLPEAGGPGFAVVYSTLCTLVLLVTGAA